MLSSCRRKTHGDARRHDVSLTRGMTLHVAGVSTVRAFDGIAVNAGRYSVNISAPLRVPVCPMAKAIRIIDGNR